MWAQYAWTRLLTGGFQLTETNKCVECKYARLLGNDYACTYILYWSTRRPCSVEDCTVFEPVDDVEYKRRLSKWLYYHTRR